MYRKNQQSKGSQNLVESSSSDSESNSDSSEQRTASDVINSFLNRNKAVQHVNTAKSRTASDVINAFLQRNKIVDQANQSQFRSALDVINSYLKKDKFAKNATVSCKRRKESSDDSTSDSDSDLVSRKRRRVTSESSSTSDTSSSTDRNVAKKRRIEGSAGTTNEPAEPICQTYSSDKTTSLQESSPPIICSTVSKSSQLELRADTDESREQSRVDSSKRCSSKGNGASSGLSTSKANAKPKQNTPAILKISFTREVVGRTGKTKIVKQQTMIKDNKIPKDRYDRALDMLNSAECRYDETPVYYSVPKASYDIRRACNARRHAEATYDTLKLGTSLPISLTRIVFEMDNCLKRENWQQMAELIYFGCGLMKTEQSRRAIGTTFFTYALLLLILDSTPSSISTLGGKRNEIMKFLTALGSEPDESEEFLKELNLGVEVSDTTNDLLVIKSEID